MVSRVQALLEQYPTYRENKYKVIAHVLWFDLPKRLQTPEVNEVLRLVAESKLPATETISRSWRKVIELHPAWQTETFKKERKAQEGDIIDQLHDLTKENL